LRSRHCLLDGRERTCYARSSRCIRHALELSDLAHQQQILSSHISTNPSYHQQSNSSTFPNNTNQQDSAPLNSTSLKNATHPSHLPPPILLHASLRSSKRPWLQRSTLRSLPQSTNFAHCICRNVSPPTMRATGTVVVARA